MFLNLWGFRTEDLDFGSLGEGVGMWSLGLSSFPMGLFGRRGKGVKWRESSIWLYDNSLPYVLSLNYVMHLVSFIFSFYIVSNININWSLESWINSIDLFILKYSYICFWQQLLFGFIAVVHFPDTAWRKHQCFYIFWTHQLFFWC